MLKEKQNLGSTILRFIQKNLMWLGAIFFVFVIAFYVRQTITSTTPLRHNIEIAFFIYLILSFIAICVCIQKTKKLHILFLVFAIILSIGYLIVIPLGMVPDEFAHYLRSFEIAQGDFLTPVLGEGTAGNYFPNHILGYNQTNVTYQEAFSHWGEQLDYGNMVTYTAYSGAALYSPLCYIASSLGIFISHLFTDNAMVVFYAARIFNCIMGIALIYFAIKIIPYAKFAVFTIGLMPMFLHQSISASADVMTNAMAIFCVAFVLWLAQKEKVKKWHLAVFAVSLILLTMCKVIYILFILLALIIPNNRFQSKKGTVLYKVLLMFGAIFINLIWLGITTRYFGTTNEGVDIAGQISFVLTHPFNYIGTLLRTILDDFPSYLSNLTGSSMGWLIVPTSFWGYGVYQFILIIALFVVCNNKKIATFHKFIFAAIFFGTGLLTLSALYAQWNPVASLTIAGVQGRYFIPIVLCLACFAPQVRMWIKQKLPATGSSSVEESPLTEQNSEVIPYEQTKPWGLYLLIMFCNCMTLIDLINHYAG
ncbi:DUF2142 domain-containing protein [Clostridium facile]|uniref:DUF2142 domain-containing protein n=1 Tax=Clostridium facile TaxID=2763035 RepID=A0ABR7IP61_9CLOT|nr:DUF2142 domain-containing protein [Clostridium facile]MBC5786873.1 DUF2142 domain-containing protein [Clostridium facile]